MKTKTFISFVCGAFIFSVSGCYGPPEVEETVEYNHIWYFKEDLQCHSTDSADLEEELRKLTAVNGRVVTPNTTTPSGTYFVVQRRTGTFTVTDNQALCIEMTDKIRAEEETKEEIARQSSRPAEEILEVVLGAKVPEGLLTFKGMKKHFEKVNCQGIGFKDTPYESCGAEILCSATGSEQKQKCHLSITFVDGKFSSASYGFPLDYKKAIDIKVTAFLGEVNEFVMNDPLAAGWRSTKEWDTQDGYEVTLFEHAGRMIVEPYSPFHTISLFISDPNNKYEDIKFTHKQDSQHTDNPKPNNEEDIDAPRSVYLPVFEKEEICEDVGPTTIMEAINAVEGSRLIRRASRDQDGGLYAYVADKDNNPAALFETRQTCLTWAAAVRWDKKLTRGSGVWEYQYEPKSKKRLCLTQTGIHSLSDLFPWAIKRYGAFNVRVIPPVPENAESQKLDIWNAEKDDWEIHFFFASEATCKKFALATQGVAQELLILQKKGK